MFSNLGLVMSEDGNTAFPFFKRITYLYCHIHVAKLQRVTVRIEI